MFQLYHICDKVKSIMIDIKEIFNDTDIAKCVSLWLPDSGDSADLVGAVEYAAEMNVSMLSVKPTDVGVIWPWVEKLKLKTVARFDAVCGDAISGLVVDIKSVFKQGADGAQIIVKLNEIDRFVNSIESVRDDLFFNKTLSLGLDVFEIWPLDWDLVFDSLKKIHASSLLLILTHDDMEKSDFTGRIYGALMAWNANSDMELHVMFGESWSRAEQVYRLVKALRPELLNKLKFFISY